MQNSEIAREEQRSREWSSRNIHGGEEQNQKRSPMEWWYRLTAPPPARPTASLAERELARRGRLTSLVLLGVVIIATFIAVPVVALENPQLAPAIGALDVILFVALWFNRKGHIYIAGIIVVVNLSIGLPASIITAPGGLSSNSMPLYDVMVQSELFAISLLPAATVFLIAALNCTFIVLDFYLQPHTPDLNAMIAKAGAEVLARPILLHVLIAVVAYLWVRSAMQAIERADRAEVIAILEHDMAEQEHAVAQQKRLLDKSVQQIVETHTRVANGDITARVPLTQDNVLWEIAGSLNNLLSRFQRMLQNEQNMRKMGERVQWAMRVEYEVMRMKKEIEKQISFVRQAKHDRRPVHFLPTRTIIDPLLAELNEASFPERGPAKSSLLSKSDTD